MESMRISESKTYAVIEEILAVNVKLCYSIKMTVTMWINMENIRYDIP